ncbi:MAG: hypothetical protein GY718_09440 [Lentisphaerae bacterium]|nr:hypothetical protein [Lentisphaerota bacterium]
MSDEGGVTLPDVAQKPQTAKDGSGQIQSEMKSVSYTPLQGLPWHPGMRYGRNDESRTQHCKG